MRISISPDNEVIAHREGRSLLIGRLWQNSDGNWRCHFGGSPIEFFRVIWTADMLQTVADRLRALNEGGPQ